MSEPGNKIIERSHLATA